MKLWKFIIPEFSIEVIFTENGVLTRDLIANTTLFSESFLKKVVNVIREEDYNTFSAKTAGVSEIDTEPVKDYDVIIEFASQHSEISTGAGYILDISVDSHDHGYYFGLYQIGEFSLDGDGNLVLLRTFDLQHVVAGSGLVDEKLMYVILREEELPAKAQHYYLIKLDWEKNPPEFIWKKSLKTAAGTMLTHGKKLYIGMNDGSLEIWDLEEGKILEAKQLFTNGVRKIERGFQDILLSAQSGETAALTEEGEILWKTKLGASGIQGLVEDERGIHLASEKGDYSCLAPKTGEKTDSFRWVPIPASNLVVVRDWLVGSGSYGVHGVYLKDKKKTYHHFMEDPLIRRFVRHPRGFITGDDDGKIRFWKIGGIKIVEVER
ncbi:MAG: hypothetical protein ACFFD4_28645 [Candidatus Odinarchaeota archaeon]